ncbi:hypothetical protein EJ06DRAFT_553565 [Trichodelitschia bisporula]|uniref:Uncharacterized protein n=1 Tax=Trichodelitschia bisporula TaxID=703511 RepID=A0A6G1I981_9PEZI|nr:hypothetical protein EJ06DRAFT_553565 [Trichodelitschia bisporula]
MDRGMDHGVQRGWMHYILAEVYVAIMYFFIATALRRVAHTTLGPLNIGLLLHWILSRRDIALETIDSKTEGNAE